MKYDWKKINKLFKSLGVPEGFLNPCIIPWDSANWHTIYSKRNEGKTTNIILYGLCQRKLYGSSICYIRADEDDIRPMFLNTLMSVIVEYGYIEKLTDGEYNNCILKNKKWYYTFYNSDEQKIEKIDSEPFMYVLSIDQWYNYKSGLNIPNGDWLILDEFARPTHSISEFVDFNQLISTIRRGRDSMKIILLGNTITTHDLYFKELCIEKLVRDMKKNESRIVKTPLGTSIFVFYFSTDTYTKLTEKRKMIDNAYHGFKGMNSILGDGWEVENYPHITSEMYDDEILVRVCIDCQIELLKLDLRCSELLGIYATVQPTNKRDGTIIFTNDTITKDNEIGGVGATVEQKKLFALHKIGRCFFATNDCGELFENYIKNSIQIIRKRGF